MATIKPSLLIKTDLIEVLLEIIFRKTTTNLTNYTLASGIQVGR